MNSSFVVGGYNQAAGVWERFAGRCSKGVG